MGCSAWLTQPARSAREDAYSSVAIVAFSPSTVHVVVAPSEPSCNASRVWVGANECEGVTVSVGEGVMVHPVHVGDTVRLPVGAPEGDAVEDTEGVVDGVPVMGAVCERVLVGVWVVEGVCVTGEEGDGVTVATLTARKSVSNPTLASKPVLPIAILKKPASPHPVLH